MKEISSHDNPALKRLAALFFKKERDKQGCYVIEGPNLLREALRNGVSPESVFFRGGSLCGAGAREYEELLSELCRQGQDERLRRVSDAVFDRIGETDTPQGVMAVVKKRGWTEEELFDGRAPGNILVLDRLQDPGNLGTMLRTADGAGFSGAILMKGCGDLYSPKVARACTGTLFRLPVLFCGTPAEAFALLRRHEKKIYATALKDSEVYYKCDLRENVAIVVGNEGNGVCSRFLAGADGLLTIPMAGNLESLNAAVAAGILMYETVRQRNGG